MLLLLHEIESRPVLTGELEINRGREYVIPVVRRHQNITSAGAEVARIISERVGDVPRAEDVRAGRDNLSRNIYMSKTISLLVRHTATYRGGAYG